MQHLGLLLGLPVDCRSCKSGAAASVFRSGNCIVFALATAADITAIAATTAAGAAPVTSGWLQQAAPCLSAYF